MFYDFNVLSLIGILLIYSSFGSLHAQTFTPLDIQQEEQIEDPNMEEVSQECSSPSCQDANHFKKKLFKVEPATDHVCDLGEGPHWDEKKHVLYYVDAFVGDVCELKPSSGHSKCQNLKDLVTIVIPIEGQEPNNYLVSLRNKLINYNIQTKKYDVLGEVAPERNGKERFNDAKVDAKGRLWIGTVLDSDSGPVKEGGSLYRFDGSSKQFHKMSSGFTISNGMIWSRDNKKMYFNDSEERKIYVFDFHLESGTISGKKVFIDCATHQDFKEGNIDGYPDGMTIDMNDKLWIPLYAGGKVIEINQATGRVENTITIPAPKTTSCFFGGENFETLFVTTGSSAMSDEEKKKYPHAGKVFKVTSDDPHGGPFRGGAPGHKFKF